MLYKIIFGIATAGLILTMCMENPTEVRPAPLEGSWVEVAGPNGAFQHDKYWVDLRIVMDSFYMSQQIVERYCKQDTVADRCAPPCSNIVMIPFPCVFAAETLGVQYAGGKIATVNDNCIAFDGMMTDTLSLPVSTLDAPADIVFAERFRFFWRGDTLVLTNDSDLIGIERKLVRSYHRTCGNEL